MPYPIHRILVKTLVKPFMWAHFRKKQTVTTRIIRAAWRAL